MYDGVVSACRSHTLGANKSPGHQPVFVSSKLGTFLMKDALQTDRRWLIENTMKANQSAPVIGLEVSPRSDVMDKVEYAKHWRFSVSLINQLLAKGLPHAKVGSRRVRFLVAESDRWMLQTFGAQRFAAKPRSRPEELPAAKGTENPITNQGAT